VTDKRRQLIEAAIRLFADKGYHATSIQEIADSVGIAKGSLYSYFQSKEDLLLSIYSHYYELIEYRMTSFALKRGVSPRDRLIEQTAALFEEFERSREFFLMQMKEQVLANLKDTQDFMYHMIVKTHTWYTQSVLEIFGDRIQPYANDCAALLNGMISEFMKYNIFYGLNMDHKQTAAFLVERMEDLVEGILRRQPEPVLTPEIIAPLLKLSGCAPLSISSRMMEELKRLRILWTDDQSGETEDYLGALNVIEEELAKDSPNQLVLKGMIALLKQSGLPESSALCEMVDKLTGYM